MKSTSPKESKRSPIRFSVGFLNNPALFTAGNMAYSDFYQLRIPGYRLFVVTDPQVIRHILVQQKAKYQKSKMYWKQLRAIIGRGMGSLDGEEWLFLRKLQNPYFLKSRVSQYLETVPPATEIHLQQWRQWSGQTIDIIPLISRLNTQILLQCLFGMQAADSYAEIARRIADGQATISWRSKYPWRPMTGWLNGRNQRAQQHLNFFDRFLEDQLSRIDPEADNLFNALHQSPQLQPTDLRNELIIHLGAGTETAAVSEAWALYLLAKNPDILGRVRKEISDLAGDQPLQAQHA
ncbi:MAG: cytochrome P450, partial [Phaeodactylibacter sp.]|nr:cytochrome P450 [Phaeodactylibacter sp.]